VRAKACEPRQLADRRPLVLDIPRCPTVPREAGKRNSEAPAAALISTSSSLAPADQWDPVLLTLFGMRARLRPNALLEVELLPTRGENSPPLAPVTIAT